MNYLKEGYRPQSEDPLFWETWTGTEPSDRQISRPIDWKTIADEWQRIDTEAEVDPSARHESSADATEEDEEASSIFDDIDDEPASWEDDDEIPF
jgi:hypothetical protein